MAALHARFVGQDEGLLHCRDADFDMLKVMVNNTYGSQTAMTLAQAGITQVNRKTDATEIRFDGGTERIGQAIALRSGLGGC